MRLTAAALLLAQALPSTADTQDAFSAVAEAAARLGLGNGRSPIVHSTRKLGMGRRRRMTRMAPMRASRSSMEECDPDIGLLSCGHGMYCISSQESTLGGVCTSVLESPTKHRPQEKRGLLDSTPGIGNHYCDYYYDICDCDNWDSVFELGSITCTQKYCSYDCSYLCYEFDMTYTNDGTNWEQDLCYNFFKPYEQNWCSSISSHDTCTITLDDEACSLCNVTGVRGYPDGCGAFDCENVGMGSGDFCYNLLWAPIESVCECTICPGTELVYGDATIKIPGFGDYTCTGLEEIASGGYLDAPSCENLSAFVNSTCCREYPSASPSMAPTAFPTISPSPTVSPSKSPSGSPTISMSPSISSVPTAAPVPPTTMPSYAPTGSPTDVPTSQPTVTVTDSPTQTPSISPTSGANSHYSTLSLLLAMSILTVTIAL